MILSTRQTESIMKIIHTADLHLGQVIYQHYDRSDEHRHFFDQLTAWCIEHQPDALLVCGDVFDIQQPSAAVKKAFTEYFVELHRQCPTMVIVITAGNHDSASRIQADSAVWTLANARVVGTAPQSEPAEGWEEKYIVELDNGYIVAMPYMIGERTEALQHLLDKIKEKNHEGKPVVMMGHTAVTGLDLLGHSIEVGTLKPQSIQSFGSGFDYLALGHIHKPQTIGHQEDAKTMATSYPAPVVRYSGSALHVSCDEAYPHTVSLVEIDKHEGEVQIRQLRIDELRHFYTLPLDGSSYTSAKEALKGIREFCKEKKSGYIRLRVDIATNLPANFSQMVYDELANTHDEVRYNPKIDWTGKDESRADKQEKPTFEVAELQQMTNPLDFIEKTLSQYADLEMDKVRQAFVEVEAEIVRMEEEAKSKASAKAAKKAEGSVTTED